MVLKAVPHGSGTEVPARAALADRRLEGRRLVRPPRTRAAPAGALVCGRTLANRAGRPKEASAGTTAIPSAGATGASVCSTLRTAPPLS